MTANNRTLEKIAKCFALAKSSNPYEAEAALRQAHKMLARHQLTEADVATSEIRLHEVQIGDSGRQPPAWCIRLAEVCAVAMECLVVVRHGAGQHLAFIGWQDNAEWAVYAWQVLHRQLKQARREYTSTLTRCNRNTKRQRGDLFARAWIQSVRELIRDFAGLDESTRMRLESWRDQQFGPLEPAVVPPLKRPNSRNVSALLAGAKAGRKARLHRAVAGRSPSQQLTVEGL